MNRLLNRTLLYYTLLAAFILALSAPFFYWMIEKLYVEDVDEAIQLRKKEFLINNLASLKTSDIATWNSFNRDTRILPDTLLQKKDSIIQETFFDAMTPEWEPYRVLYTSVAIQGRPYVLMIRLNLVESEDLIKTLAWLYLGVLLALLLVVFFITLAISNRLWKSFVNTLQQIEQFNIEQNRQPVFAPTSIKEFQQLHSGLSKLINSNLRAYQIQKEFTQNAAHELQTPLAIFQTKLDLLLQDASLTGEQATILQSLYEAASRLTRITKNLLLLAKIENEQFVETGPLTIGELIEDTFPWLNEQAEEKNITIKEEVKNDIHIVDNQGLVEILINNILLNAIRHNRENGKLNIEVVENKLIVSNTSTRDALDLSALFKRFGKSCKLSGSSGLGLSIIKQICERYGWQITYEHKKGLHYFSVIF